LGAVPNFINWRYTSSAKKKCSVKLILDIYWKGFRFYRKVWGPFYNLISTMHYGSLRSKQYNRLRNSTIDLSCILNTKESKWLLDKLSNTKLNNLSSTWRKRRNFHLILMSLPWKVNSFSLWGENWHRWLKMDLKIL
jgi:hypothetical protein